MAPWNRRFLLETIIFRFHDKLREGKLYTFCVHHYIGVNYRESFPRKPAPKRFSLPSTVTAAQWLIQNHGALPNNPAMRKPHQHHLQKQRPFDLGCQNQETWIWSWNLEMIQVSLGLPVCQIQAGKPFCKKIVAFHWLTMHQVMPQLIQSHAEAKQPQRSLSLSLMPSSLKKNQSFSYLTYPDHWQISSFWKNIIMSKWESSPSRVEH